MNRLILTPLLTMLFVTGINAQTSSGFGFKGGLNYNANGKYFESISENAKNPDRNIGYHLGIFGKIGSKVYFKPELVYTSTKSDYDNDTFKMEKIDAPLLVGVKVLGAVSVFGGPAFQYILDTEYDGISINDIENDFTLGLNFGIGLNFKRMGLDLRYERGFSDNEAKFFLNNISSNPDRLDTRPDQLILSLSFIL
ncbi:outer membrane beta-barrel protein [Aestuariivivens marinum]|uniref:outer membrane beta-barrel protein n=1 Tax=Aestuariivivens marinum TaxID=2913555 RepID=UPI001F55B033|nr:outer membrane beta-barrel protein [Aestuariivivens marinum]